MISVPFNLLYMICSFVFDGSTLMLEQAAFSGSFHVFITTHPWRLSGEPAECAMHIIPSSIGVLACGQLISASFYSLSICSRGLEIC
jgi:hypothetical protein